jgi:hypothetical protein
MPRPPNLSKFSITELEGMIQQRRRGLKTLYKRRTKALRELARIEDDIASLGGESGGDRGGGHGKRARNDKPLPDVMEEVMRAAGKPMGIQAITDAVLATGFRSTSKAFKGLVNQALFKDNRFAKADRGVYQLKK